MRSILKVHNGVESDNTEFLEGMQALLLVKDSAFPCRSTAFSAAFPLPSLELPLPFQHLRAHGIVAPYPVSSTARLRLSLAAPKR